MQNAFPLPFIIFTWFLYRFVRNLIVILRCYKYGLIDDVYYNCQMDKWTIWYTYFWFWQSNDNNIKLAARQMSDHTLTFCTRKKISPWTRSFFDHPLIFPWLNFSYIIVCHVAMGPQIRGAVTARALRASRRLLWRRRQQHAVPNRTTLPFRGCIYIRGCVCLYEMDEITSGGVFQTIWVLV